MPVLRFVGPYVNDGSGWRRATMYEYVQQRLRVLYPPERIARLVWGRP